MKNPKVSVVMTLYNESLEIAERSLYSILKQTFIDFEFIIVLDDPTNIDLFTYIKNISERDSRIKIIQNKENLKAGAASNVGISRSRGKYIARMDGDDTCDITRLEKQYIFLENNTEIDVVFTGWNEVNETGISKVRIPSQKDFRNISKTFFYKSPILHASMMGKREIFMKFRYPEIDRPQDFGLYLDIIAHGYRFSIIEEDLYTYYIDSEDIERKFQKAQVFSSNFLHLLWKHKNNYKTNPYFWWMVFICSIQWILTRSRIVFFIFFKPLQFIYTKLFIS